MNVLALQDAVPQLFDMSPTGTPDTIGAWMICFFTLAVFSFLYKDNPFYKIAEHVFVGAGTAFFALQYYKEGILEPVVDHLGNAIDKLDTTELVQLGGFGVDPWLAIALRGLAAIFALMLLSRLFAPNSWAPRWPLAIMVGVYAALKMTGETQSKLVLQIKGAMKPLTDSTRVAWGEPWARIEETQLYYTFANAVLLVGVICALSHFIFTYKRGRLLNATSRIGVITLMITFGSMFGFTVLGRIALLIERIDQLGFYTGSAYSLWPDGVRHSTDWSLGELGDLHLDMSQVVSPPFLLAILITLVLLLGALQGRGRRSEG